MQGSGIFINFVADLDNNRPTTHFDSDDWHLTVYLSRRRRLARLSHTSDPTVASRSIFDETGATEPETLLPTIENAVYSNPEVLDDYSADIVIAADDTLWMPAGLTDDPDMLEQCYLNVYRDADADDLFIESEPEAGLLAVSRFSAGLKAFLERTFPGARVSSRQMALLRRFRCFPGGGTRVYVHLEEGEAIVLTFDGKRLLCASTMAASTPEDTLYCAMLPIKAYGLDSASAEVFLSGDKELRRESISLMRQYLGCVMHTMLPGGLDDGLPLAAAVCAARHLYRNSSES